ncbi:uncharacterized protein ColSpa_03368 [Colletotrichum spaethianum]|uniref:Uncharacterized protein n=1 Tax=Colletotrichum spaethianum TaxID=700344 RepID=A0AA37L7D0_9PEZI|nr:uncharacterized protein ColSpa_03368 [Colletotrichum spaethianum]GKT43187.1 hypothetical protein ColSpa_03368 [Colletotrichum spaethianum]
MLAQSWEGGRGSCAMPAGLARGPAEELAKEAGDSGESIPEDKFGQEIAVQNGGLKINEWIKSANRRFRGLANVRAWPELPIWRWTG